MGLFSKNYNTPGPGVSKTEKRKKGFARFLEVAGRDMSSLFKANLLCCIAFLPGILGVAMGLTMPNLPFTLLCGFLGGMIAGPVYAGMHDTVLRALRDEPGYWWHTYKRAFKNNWKQSLLPGGLLGFLIASQLFTCLLILEGVLELGFVSIMLLAMNLLLTGMCFPYLFAQLVLFDLSTVQLFKNSILLALSSAPRALIVAVVQTAFWGVCILFINFSPLVVLVFGFWLMTIFSMMMYYPTLEKVFDMESKFAELRENQMNPDVEAAVRPLPEDGVWPPSIPAVEADADEAENPDASTEA